ncbi:uncharacterized protein TNCV_2840061 [Trichonephila clavipes]|uniref:Uncharacterized protein n=1 Tax=Trichonephila clavipes TaxID=2585209 RepID=A0A8X6RTX1_TRICX|nr:uncharacterized protein TNCV_2840061 [Trichonephila clavipes]
MCPIKTQIVYGLSLRRAGMSNTRPASTGRGCGSPGVKVSDHGRYVMSSSPVPPKTRLVGERCSLNLSRAQTSSRWCGVVVRRGGFQLRCHPRHLTMVQNYEFRRQKALV